MLTEILKNVEIINEDETGFFQISEVEWDTFADSIQITLEMQLEQNAHTQKWQVLGKYVQEHRIISDRYCLDLAYTKNHVLLWPHTEPNASLWFKGQTEEYNSLIGELWQIHHSLTGGWFPFSRFLNQPNNFFELLAGRHGLLAHGPQPLISAYATKLENYGLKASITTTRPPCLLRGNNISKDEVGALIIGESYIVAANFESKLIEE